jgi:hypothetical protein
MRPAPKIVLQIQRILGRRAFVGCLVSLIAIVNKDDIGFVFDFYVRYLPIQQKNIPEMDDLEPVLVWIFEVVVVGNSGAVGVTVIQRIVAAGFASGFVGKIRLAAQGLDRLIEKISRLASIF